MSEQSGRKSMSRRARQCVELMSDGRWYTGQQITELLGYVHPNRAMTDVRHAGYIVETRWRQAEGRKVAEWRLLGHQSTGCRTERTPVGAHDALGLFQRDGFRCALCMRSYAAADLRVDHRVPIHKRTQDFSKEESGWLDELQALCQWCNYK